MKWISVEDRLPPYGEIVLFRVRPDDNRLKNDPPFKDKPNVIIGHRNCTNEYGEDWREGVAEGGYGWTATHWMPLPEKPKQ